MLPDCARVAKAGTSNPMGTRTMTFVLARGLVLARLPVLPCACGAISEARTFASERRAPGKIRTGDRRSSLSCSVLHRAMWEQVSPPP